MSAGAFAFVTYGASYDGSQSHPIRVQPETLLASANGQVNTALVGDPVIPISVNVGGSRRANGIHARIVRLALTGSPPTGYAVGSKTVIPIIDPANFASFSVRNTTVTYLGTTWRVTGSTSESVN